MEGLHKVKIPVALPSNLQNTNLTSLISRIKDKAIKLQNKLILNLPMKKTSSPLKQHYLSSILPYQEINKPKEFIKSRQFFQPESFIWNNAHRTSKRLYPYYHLQHDQYQAQIKPKIEEMEEQDRMIEEEIRINRLTSFRQEMRKKFSLRQKSREELETKSSRTKRIKLIETDLNPEILPRMNSIKPKFYGMTTSPSECCKSSENGEKFDANLIKIQEMISDQILKNHKKIKLEFYRRREINSEIAKPSSSKQIQSTRFISKENF